MRAIWPATFKFASFRRLPLPNVVVLHLALDRDGRMLRVELNQAETTRLAQTLTKYANDWPEED